MFEVVRIVYCGIKNYIRVFVYERGVTWNVPIIRQRVVFLLFEIILGYVS